MSDKIQPDKIQKALTGFRSGKNCAQALLTAFSDDLEFDEEFALAISSGFGGGMGRLQETCGAVTGSFMVLGIYNKMKYTDNDSRKEHTYAMIQEFNRQFTSMHKSTSCSVLLGIDLNTEAGRQMMTERKLSEYVCERCIADAVRIVADVTSES